jgi:hypothetical protein
MATSDFAKSVSRLAVGGMPARFLLDLFLPREFKGIDSEPRFPIEFVSPCLTAS